MSTDYLSIQYIECTRNQGDGERVEKYYNQLRDSYDIIIREQRFGDIQYQVENMQERDADQLLEAAKSTDITTILEPEK